MSSAGKVDPLVTFALEVACCAPKKNGRQRYYASIPWQLIEDIRRECESRQISWRALQDSVKLQVATRAARAIRTRLEDRRLAQEACKHDWGKGDNINRCRKCKEIRDARVR